MDTSPKERSPVRNGGHTLFNFVRCAGVGGIWRLLQTETNFSTTCKGWHDLFGNQQTRGDIWLTM
jgi:hypothetical protein